MYYIVYGFLYLISLLPFFILYFLSDVAYFIIYHIIGYRKEVVFSNLTHAFPEKSKKEIEVIAKKFYRGFCDTFVEIIKTISLSDKEFDKRCTGDLSAVNRYHAQGRNIQLLGGHMFNWEYANLAGSKHTGIPGIGIYGKIEHEVFDKIIYKIRSKYNTILISTATFKRSVSELMKNQYVIYLLADQIPSNFKNSYWLNFFSRPAPFITGPAKSALRYNTVIIFINFRKIKRGYYTIDCEKIIEDPSKFTPEEITIQYRDFIEEMIRRQPENYLWSHRRWKGNYSEDFQHLWIDKN